MAADDRQATRAGWDLTAEQVAKSPDGLDLPALLDRIELASRVFFGCGADRGRFAAVLETVEMTRCFTQTLFVASLLALAGVAAQSAGTGDESSPMGSLCEQHRTRAPDAVLRSVADGDFTTVLRDLLCAAGQPQATIRIRPTDNEKTAAAFVERGRNIIEFNPKFMSQLSRLAETDWAIVLILSHEAAHLLAGHATLPRPATRRPLSRDDLRRMELQANRATGFLLARLGASLAESARSLRAACVLTRTDEDDCTAYEEVIEAGWRAGTQPQSGFATDTTGS